MLHVEGVLEEHLHLLRRHGRAVMHLIAKLSWPTSCCALTLAAGSRCGYASGTAYTYMLFFNIYAPIQEQLLMAGTPCAMMAAVLLVL